MNAIDLAIHLGRGEYDWIPEAMEMLNKQYDRIKELEAWQKHDIELAEAIGFDRAHKLQADRIAELEKQTKPLSDKEMLEMWDWDSGEILATDLIDFGTAIQERILGK